MHFLPELKLHATLGYDYAQGEGLHDVYPEAAQYYTTGGYYYPYGPQKNVNRLLTIYANYNKMVESLKQQFRRYNRLRLSVLEISKSGFGKHECGRRNSILCIR